MTKKDKLRNKLFALPAPKGFTWNELISLMTQEGFSNSCEGGSHYIFEHIQTGKRLFISKTHPSGILKAYQVKDVKEVITESRERAGEKNGNK